MSAHDTLRWGDVEQIVYKGVPEASPRRSKQLLQAHWDWPLTWTVLLTMVPTFPAAETGTFDIFYFLTIGVGQAQLTYPIHYVLAPVAGAYSAIVDQKFVPAENLQISASIVSSNAISAGDAIQLGAFAAPQTEPHTGREMLQRMRGEAPPGVQWMPAGFEPEPLGYKR